MANRKEKGRITKEREKGGRRETRHYALWTKE